MTGTFHVATLAAVTIIAGCAQGGGTPAGTGAAAHQAQGDATATGSFTGASGHVTSGTASIIHGDDGWIVSFGPDFAFDGAPDPVVALGHDGYDASAQLAPLSSDSGEQTFVIPAGLDVGDYNEIHIWCEQFDVPLGVARLEPN